MLFPEVYVIAWSALSFLMGATVYYELQRYSDSLYHHQQSLLSRFPLDTTHYSRVGCNGMATLMIHSLTTMHCNQTEALTAPYQGSTADTEKISCTDHDFAYHNGCFSSLTNLKICLKIFFCSHGIFLWEEEVKLNLQN